MSYLPEDPYHPQDEYTGFRNSQAWRLAGLIQDRLTYPIGETAIAIPGGQHASQASGSPQIQDGQAPSLPAPDISQASGEPNTNLPATSKNWDGAVYTHVVPTGGKSSEPAYGIIQLRVGRTRTAARGGKSWIEFSYDGGAHWKEVASVPKTQEKIDGRQAASVERPYIYTAREDDKLKIVLGTCAADPESKRWDIFERTSEIPLTDIANPGAWTEAMDRIAHEEAKLVIEGNGQCAYKDAVPIPDENGDYGKYLAVTVHEIGNSDPAIPYDPALAVNAHSELFERDDDGIKYHHKKNLLEKGTEEKSPDFTCSRYTGRLPLLDSICVFRDIRNRIEPNAAFTHRQIGFHWPIDSGDFDEMASCALCLRDDPSQTEIDADLTPIPAVLGRSSHDMFPTLRYLDVTPLISPEAFVELTQEAKRTDGQLGIVVNYFNHWNVAA